MTKINGDDFKNIKIDKSEVLKYLGYKSDITVDKNLISICDECIKIIEKSSNPLFLYSYFDIEIDNNAVEFLKTPLLLKGKSIKAHLKSCEKSAVFCVTLSNDVDKIIERAKFDVLRQMILDIAASVYIEQICEKISEIIKNENQNFFITKRYGIGYGDLSLSYQQDVLTLLNAQKRIGLMATEAGILTPRKSVTAIIGLSKEKIEKAYRDCDDCLLRNDCKYFMRGEHCGK